MGGEYRVVRVNTSQHGTRALALDDLATIIRLEGYWTQSHDPPRIPVGTAIVAMGSYGGRGLYLHGVVRSDWESTGEKPFLNKLGVTWAHVVYESDRPEDIGARISAFNSRSWSRCTQTEFRAVLNRVLSGRELPVAELYIA
jgi:hypothetical protein